MTHTTLTGQASTDGRDRTALVGYLVDGYGAGRSLSQLSAETGRSFGHVRRLLLDAGVRMRPRGGRRVRTP